MRGEASHILEGCQKHTNKMYKIRVKKTEQSGCQASFIWPLYPAESHADSIRTLFLCLWNCESIVSSTWTDVNRTSHNVKFGLKLCTMARTARKEALEAKLQQILKLKEEVKAEISADSESEGNVSAVSAASCYWSLWQMYCDFCGWTWDKSDHRHLWAHPGAAGGPDLSHRWWSLLESG